jgi:hypothetical protein
MSRLVSVEGESADKSLHESHASAGVPIAVQWRRPEAQTCRYRVQGQDRSGYRSGSSQGTGHLQHMVHRKLKSRASCLVEETRVTGL